MSDVVATVNGVKVHSDKRVRGIVGTIIHFSDGSWCDVQSGQVVNNGRGYINIGHPGSLGTPEVTERGPENFSNVDALDVRNLSADVEVTVDGSRIEVSMQGPEDLVKAVEVSKQDSTVVVEGSGSGSGPGGMTIISGGSITRIGRTRGMVITGCGSIVSGDLVINDSGGSTVVVGRGARGAELIVKIKVPKGTQVSVSGVSGNTTIGDIEAAFSANVRGGGNISAGRITEGVVVVGGSGTVVVSEVMGGDFNASVSGSGDVRVQRGTINNLSAMVSGSGDVRIEARAQRAMLSISGSGDIYVRNVEVKPMATCSGSGDIRVGNWGRL